MQSRPELKPLRPQAPCVFFPFALGLGQGLRVQAFFSRIERTSATISAGEKGFST